MSAAPRDGTEFLAMFQGSRCIAKWSDQYRQWIGMNVKWGDQQTCQTLCDGWGNNPPTAWQPLPAAPVAGEK